MSRDNSSKVAVVTGAGRGLGRMIARALADRGDKVALISRGEDALKSTEAMIRETGGVALSFPTDVSDRDAVEATAKAILREIGPVSILVNAAGVFGPIEPIADGDAKAWIDTISANVFGPYLTCRAFVGGMTAQGWGRVVNVSSAAALHPPGPLNSAYATSKVALNQFTRHLAAEVAGTGVTANVIHPGDVKTDMWADIRDRANALGPEADGYRKWVDWVDSTGGDDPQKAADLILRLTRPESEHINGQFLWIDDPLQTPIPSWEPPTDGRPWS